MTPLVDWENIIVSITQAMRATLQATGDTSSMHAATEFGEYRLFRFKAGRQIGKTTGIINLVRKSDNCVIYDRATDSVYKSASDGAGNRSIITAAQRVPMLTAFSTIAKEAPHTLFLNPYGTDTLRQFMNYYIDNRDKFPKDFIVVVEE